METGATVVGGLAQSGLMRDADEPIAHRAIDQSGTPFRDKEAGAYAVRANLIPEPFIPSERLSGGRVEGDQA